MKVIDKKILTEKFTCDEYPEIYSYQDRALVTDKYIMLLWQSKRKYPELPKTEMIYPYIKNCNHTISVAELDKKTKEAISHSLFRDSYVDLFGAKITPEYAQKLIDIAKMLSKKQITMVSNLKNKPLFFLIGKYEVALFHT